MSVLRESGIVFEAELRRATRNPRILVLLGLYTLFSGLTLLVVAWISRALSAQLQGALSTSGAPDEAAEAAMVEARTGVLGFLLGDDPALLEALAQVPLLVVVVFKATLFFLPLYIALLGFDQLSGEVGPRSMRYLVVRARRSSVLLGKLGSQAALLLGVVLAIELAIFAVARVMNPDFELDRLIPALVRVSVAVFVFSLAYLSLTALCSALFRSPALSLVTNFAALFGFWILHVIGGWFSEGRWGFVRHLSPSAHSAHLLHPELGTFLQSASAYLLFSAAFVALAYGVLRRRDV